MESGIVAVIMAVFLMIAAVFTIFLVAKNIIERYMHDFRRGISTKVGRLHPNQYDRTGEFRAYVAAEEAARAAGATKADAAAAGRRAQEARRRAVGARY